jgi:hypothetical protein
MLHTMLQLTHGTLFFFFFVGLLSGRFFKCNSMCTSDVTLVTLYQLYKLGAVSFSGI